MEIAGFYMQVSIKDSFLLTFYLSVPRILSKLQVSHVLDKGRIDTALPDQTDFSIRISGTLVSGSHDLAQIAAILQPYAISAVGESAVKGSNVHLGISLADGSSINFFAAKALRTIQISLIQSFHPFIWSIGCKL